MTNQRKGGAKGNPVSMHPLSPEEALDGFMKVDPKKVKKREKAVKKGKKRRGKGK